MADCGFWSAAGTTALWLFIPHSALSGADLGVPLVPITSGLASPQAKFCRRSRGSLDGLIRNEVPLHSAAAARSLDV